MFDTVKSKIADLLKSAYPEQSVRVIIDKVPYGIWLWEENSQRHIHLKAQEVTKILGGDTKPWIGTLPEFKTHWADLLHKSN